MRITISLSIREELYAFIKYLHLPYTKNVLLEDLMRRAISEAYLLGLQSSSDEAGEIFRKMREESMRLIKENKEPR